MEKVICYLRVSDSSQLKDREGRPRDGFTRQIKSCQDYALRNHMEIAKIFQEDISGTEMNRPVLAELMIFLEKNGHGIKTVLIEKLDRLARDLMVQEAIIRDFKSKNFQLISSLEGPDLLRDDPTRKLIRQLFGAIAEYEKSMLVQKLRASRDRKRERDGRCEGRKGYQDKEGSEELLRYIRLLLRKPKGKRGKTYREVAEILNSEGYTTLSGKLFTVNRVHQLMNPVGKKHLVSRRIK